MINPELKKLINSAKQSIDNLLLSYANSKDVKLNKKSKLLSYWLRDYMKMVKKEETFNPAKLPKYKRGDIIKVHLGFNIGSEEGGLHYAIVISKFCPATSDVLTIIPLTSKKESYKPTRYDVDLNQTLYDNLNSKYENIYNDNNKQLTAITNQLQATIKKRDEMLKTLLNTDSFNDNYNDLKKEIGNSFIELEHCTNKINRLQEDMDTIRKMQTEIEHLKTGSIALVGQIKTISKIRIYNPLNKTDSLSKIRISNNDLDRIDAKIKELFTY
ncbi:MAG: type II toxin-antitoxin system PemK/MazF family toxin [Ruminococcus flavefaciens]|nr:type II toxin-antitoxin system PemK/MazF family toxin [Ruminococcus flavefaciens]